MRFARRKVGVCIVAVSLFTSLVWQAGGWEWLPRAVREARAGRLVLLDRARQMVALGSVGEAAAVHSLAVGERGLTLLVVAGGPAIDTGAGESGAGTGMSDMLLPAALRVYVAREHAAWGCESPPCRRGISERLRRYG